MSSTTLDQAHKAAREALDATGLPWKLSGRRLAYVASMTIGGEIVRGAGLSQLDAMRELHAKYLAATATDKAA